MKCPLFSAFAVLSVFCVSTVVFAGEAQSKNDNASPSNSEACAKLLTVKEKFEQLGPVALDTPTIARGVLQIGQDFEGLAPHFSELKKMESDLARGNSDAKTIESQTKQFLEKLSEEAHKKIDGKALLSGSERSVKTRKA